MVHRQGGVSQEQGGVCIYSVALDMGELAEDVVGSEIRGLGDGEGSDGGSSERIHTRSDNLSAFDLQSEADVSDADAQRRRRRARCSAVSVRTTRWSGPSSVRIS